MPLIDLANGIALYTQAINNEQAYSRSLSNQRMLRDARLKFRQAYDKIGDVPELKYVEPSARFGIININSICIDLGCIWHAHGQTYAE